MGKTKPGAGTMELKVVPFQYRYSCPGILTSPDYNLWFSYNNTSNENNYKVKEHKVQGFIFLYLGRLDFYMIHLMLIKWQITFRILQPTFTSHLVWLNITFLCILTRRKANLYTLSLIHFNHFDLELFWSDYIPQ